MKKILITGAGSYIGTSFEKYLSSTEFKGKYKVDTLDMLDPEWSAYNFSGYDAVFHVAGIAHADTENVSDAVKEKYYAVNTDLAVKTANKAKSEGVGQFVFMSSMIVYGGCSYVTADTQPMPSNFYGDSKWQADKGVRALQSKEFRVAILRPPMIYGKGSRGNYPLLAKLARRLPVFPKVNNRRSMLYIENLCEFVRLVIDNGDSGIFFPQNSVYTNTSKMVSLIAKTINSRIFIVPGTGWAVKLIMKLPGNPGKLAGKAFGDSAYDMQMSEYHQEYRIVSFEESIKRTEG